MTCTDRPWGALRLVGSVLLAEVAQLGNSLPQPQHSHLRDHRNTAGHDRSENLFPASFEHPIATQRSSKIAYTCTYGILIADL
jgi:hypothetical protein